MRPRIDRAVPKVPPREPDRKNDPHRKMVKRLPCLVCGMPANPPKYLNDPHHLQRGLPVNERGMSRKAADRYLIPLCRTDHRWAEKTGDDEAQLVSVGIDGRAIADALWRERGNEDGMTRVVLRSLLTRGVVCDG